jgi:hypothetical protein
LDQDTLKYLPPHDKERYSKLEKLFGSEGWAEIERWAVVNRMMSVERQLNATSWEQNRVAFGARQAFEMLEQLRESTEREFIQMAEDAKAAIDSEDAYDNE